MEKFDREKVSAVEGSSPYPPSLIAPALMPMIRKERFRSYLGGVLVAGKNLLGAHGCGLFLKEGEGEILPVIIACCHAEETLAHIDEWKGDECLLMDMAGRGECKLILAPIFCWSRRVGGLFYSFSPASAELRKLLPAVELLAGQVGGLLERGHLGVESGPDTVEPEDLREALRKANEARLKLGKLATLGRLVSVTIHEIFNPLSIISLNIEKLLLSAKLSEDAVKTLGLMGQQVERIERIAGRLRSMSRRPLAEVGPVQIEKLLKEVSSLLEPELKRSGVSVGLIQQGGAARVLGDENQLKQLFLNLIFNARDAMPEGGTLTIRVGTCWRGGREWVLLRFSDTGCGIPQENLPRVFEEFFSTKPEDKRMGLGLSICQEIVSAHGGSIGVNSEPGRGATFTVELPSLGSLPPSKALPPGSEGRCEQRAHPETPGLPT